MSKPSFLSSSSTFGPLKHVVQIKVALTTVRISFTPLHLLCTTSDNLYIGSSFFPLLFYTQHTAICLVLRRLPYLLLLSLLSSFLHSLLTLSLPCFPSISVSCLATPLYCLPSIQGRQHTKAPMVVLP